MAQAMAREMILSKEEKKREGLGYSLREPQAMWYVESSVAGASVETEKTNETS